MGGIRFAEEGGKRRVLNRCQEALIVMCLPIRKKEMLNEYIEKQLKI